MILKRLYFNAMSKVNKQKRTETDTFDSPFKLTWFKNGNKFILKPKMN
jgi:hypothetical protein